MTIDTSTKPSNTDANSSTPPRAKKSKPAELPPVKGGEYAAFRSSLRKAAIALHDDLEKSIPLGRVKDSKHADIVREALHRDKEAIDPLSGKKDVYEKIVGALPADQRDNIRSELERGALGYGTPFHHQAVAFIVFRALYLMSEEITPNAFRNFCDVVSSHAQKSTSIKKVSGVETYDHNITSSSPNFYLFSECLKQAKQEFLSMVAPHAQENNPVSRRNFLFGAAAIGGISGAAALNLTLNALFDPDPLTTSHHNDATDYLLDMLGVQLVCLRVLLLREENLLRTMLDSSKKTTMTAK